MACGMIRPWRSYKEGNREGGKEGSLHATDKSEDGDGGTLRLPCLIQKRSKKEGGEGEVLYRALRGADVR